jgi:hypothetical protein
VGSEPETRWKLAITDRTDARFCRVQDAQARSIRSRTGYADSTIRTMMTAHLCVEATGPGVAGYDDLTRTTRGRYRPRRLRP